MKICYTEHCIFHLKALNTRILVCLIIYPQISLISDLARYCEHWKLQVNTSKTEIVIFSKGK